MQGLAQEVTVLRPELLGTDATVGELAWVFGKDRASLGDTWCQRLWQRADGAGRLDAWAWVHLPYTVARSDGSTYTSNGANLTWQVHPDRPELLDEILDWYAGQAAGLDRFITPQAPDTDMLARLPAHGYKPDAEMGGDDGHWVQLNRRPLADLSEPALPAGFRFRTAAEVGSAAATRAHGGRFPAVHPRHPACHASRVVGGRSSSVDLSSGAAPPTSRAAYWSSVTFSIHCTNIPSRCSTTAM